MVQYARPGTQYWMGTDNLSRDLFSRVIWGGRLGLLVAVVSAGIASVLGVVVGGLAGYYGGWVDDVLSRAIDIFLMIPTFFLALLIIALFGSSIFLIMVVIGLTTWPRPARIMRSQVLTLKSRTFVKATRVSGASNYQILFRHIIPNGIPPVITTGTLLMGSAILIEAGLSFLGLGDPSTTSWGRMIQLGQRHIRIAPWMSVFPGVAMLVMVTSFNLLGDALNRALQPQLQERKKGARLVSAKPAQGAGDGEAPSGDLLEGADTNTSPLLEVRNLSMYYGLEDTWVRAVDSVSFEIERGRSLGLVGESGCGKSSVALTLLRVLPQNAEILGGSIRFAGQEVLQVPDRVFQSVRWKRMSVVFQSAMHSLNPVIPVGQQLVAAYRLHRPGSSRQEARDRVRTLFDIVGIPANRIRSYPHELSGGMRQRVVIALSLLLEPELIIADEPTTALDVLVQDQILRELDVLRERLHLSMLLISHDISIVAETCERIAVMYAGQIVEEGPSTELFSNSRHPYTRGLLGSTPALTGPRKPLTTIPGESAAITGESRGCRFAPRCPLATELCKEVDPPLVSVGPDHVSRCHYALESKVEIAWN